MWSTNPTGCIAVLCRGLWNAIYQQLCGMLLWSHTQLFNKWEGVWGATAPSSVATKGIRPLLQSWEVPFWSFRRLFSGVCFHSWCSRHGIRLDLHNRGLSDTKCNGMCQGAPFIDKLPPNVHPETFQGDSSTYRTSKEVWYSWRATKWEMSTPEVRKPCECQMGIDRASTTGIPETEHLI